MHNWTTTTCKANDITIHYTRTGGNKPPVILLHGLMTNGLCWTNLARTLEKEYDVIMPDARGHGQSDIPSEGYRYDDLANDVEGLIQVLKLSKPFLIGHSMGGMTAAVVAGRTPSLIKKVVLADPPFITTQLQEDVWNSDVAEQHKKVLSLPLEEVIADGRARHPHRSLETIELFAKARLQTSMAAFEVLRPPYPDYKTLVSEIAIPALLVFGDRGVVTMDIANELHGLKKEQIANAGHSLHMDQPARFAEIIQSFLS